MTNDTITIKAIAANLEALEQLLYEANVRASEAVATIQQGERNGAIGAVLGLDQTLDAARALYSAAIALHRTARGQP